MHPGLEHSDNSQRIRFLFLKNLGLEITINDNLNMKYINLNDNVNMKYNRAQHTPTSGCKNISTMIEIRAESLTDLFLVRSEFSCHIILSCQKKCLFAVAQHNIFELYYRRGRLCANLYGQRHNSMCLALRVSHDPGHVSNLKFDSHHILFLPKERGDNAKAAGFCLFRAPVT